LSGDLQGRAALWGQYGSGRVGLVRGRAGPDRAGQGNNRTSSGQGLYTAITSDLAAHVLPNKQNSATTPLV